MSSSDVRGFGNNRGRFRHTHSSFTRLQNYKTGNDLRVELEPITTPDVISKMKFRAFNSSSRAKNEKTSNKHKLSQTYYKKQRYMKSSNIFNRMRQKKLSPNKSMYDHNQSGRNMSLFDIKLPKKANNITSLNRINFNKSLLKDLNMKSKSVTNRRNQDIKVCMTSKGLKPLNQDLKCAK